MQGKRVNLAGHQLQPGEYTYLEGGQAFYAMSPNGLLCNLIRHTIMEHADGTITVKPSILVSQGDKSWHGYLERGIWREC